MKELLHWSNIMNQTREIKTPFVVICYGVISPDNQRLFAIMDKDVADHPIMPVFTVFEMAEEFRKYHNDIMLKQVLPFSILNDNLGGDSLETLPEQLQLCVIKSPKQADVMMKLVHIKMGMVYITINPVPDRSMLCLQEDELTISDGSASNIV